MTSDRSYSHGEPIRCGNREFIPVYYSVTVSGQGFGYRQIVPWVLLIVEDETVTFVSLGEEVSEDDLRSIITGLFRIPDPSTK